MDANTIANGEVRPCCTSRQHLRIVVEMPHLTHYRCEAVLDDGTVCGRNHYVGRADPLQVGATTRPLGG